MSKVRSMLSTIDNPHDPFTDFKAWYAYDVAHGYHSASLLARIANTSYELPEEEYERALEDAIDEIIEMNISGVFVKVTKELPDIEELVVKATP